MNEVAKAPSRVTTRVASTLPMKPATPNRAKNVPIVRGPASRSVCSNGPR